MDFISEKNPFSEKQRRGTKGETVKTSTSNVNDMPPDQVKSSPTARLRFQMISLHL